MQLLRTLIKEGVDPDMHMWVENHKKTLLSLACESGKENVVDTLITEYNTDIDLQDGSGYTPLMIAAKKGLLSIVHTLIERCSCIVI